jgi:hypothetical protein
MRTELALVRHQHSKSAQTAIRSLAPLRKGGACGQQEDAQRDSMPSEPLIVPRLLRAG